MLDTLTLTDIIKILAKKFKIIITITLICTILSEGIFLYSQRNANPVTYEMKLYGVVNYNNELNQNTSINYVVNTVRDVFDSNAIKSSITGMDFNKISQSSYLKGYDVSNLSSSDKTKISNVIFKNYTSEFSDDYSKMFSISVKSGDENSAEYIAQYIFGKGSEIIRSNVEGTELKLISKELTAAKNNTLTDIIKNIILYGIASALVVCIVFIIYILSTNKILNINQIKRKYKIDIITSFKKEKCNYSELKSILLYKLNKKGKKVLIFTSSYNNKEDMQLILNLKNGLDKDNVNSAIVLTTDSIDSNEKDVYFYRSDFTDDEKNHFWKKLNIYDIIMIKADSILTSGVTEELIIKHNNIVLYEKCFTSKFNELDRTIEKISMFDGEIEGLILAE